MPVDLMLYAAVPEPKMLEQGFYKAEVDGLCAIPGVRNVLTTNSLADVRCAEVDGIVSYFYSYSAAVGLIARSRGIPTVATGGCEQLLRDTETSWRTYAARVAAFHACTALVDSLLATSTEDYERMLRVAVVGRSKIKRSFHGVAAVEQADPSHFHLQRNPASLVTIAGLDTELNVQRKGVLHAVDLLARFYRDFPSASLTIIGRTTCRDTVEAYASKLGVKNRVRFAGYVTEAEKLSLLHRSRFYVQLSEYEGFGIGALEALAHGCQVIHTNVGGLRDTIGNYGIILSRDNVDHFDPLAIAPYTQPDWGSFSAHLAKFTTVHRAKCILQALGLMEAVSNHTGPSIEGKP